MKFISYSQNNKSSIGVLTHNKDKFIDIYDSSKGVLPNDMMSYLQDFDKNNALLKQILIKEEYEEIDLESVQIKAPLPNPTSFRDAYAFRQHVEAGRKNRGLDMIEEFDQFPVYYYSNADGVVGPGDIIINDIFMEKLDMIKLLVLYHNILM